MNTKSFDLGDVLSITTGCLLSPSGMGGIYKILNYMTGDNLYTHQLMRAEAECRPELLRQHPALADVKTPALSGQTEVETWVAAMAKIHGETLPVQPLPDGVHAYIDPIGEFKAMKSEDVLILPIVMEVQDT